MWEILDTLSLIGFLLALVVAVVVGVGFSAFIAWICGEYMEMEERREGE